jgi:hypothetical protein
MINKGPSTEEEKDINLVDRQQAFPIAKLKIDPVKLLP